MVFTTYFFFIVTTKIYEQTQISNQLFSYFKCIRILDATVFQVPNTLENVYFGSRECSHIQIDVKQILKPLQPGELKNAYIGDKHQLFAHVIFNSLTEKQLQKRRAQIAEKEKSKYRIYSERSKLIAGLNVYVTNTPWE